MLFRIPIFSIGFCLTPKVLFTLRRKNCSTLFQENGKTARNFFSKTEKLLNTFSGKRKNCKIFFISLIGKEGEIVLLKIKLREIKS